jgi:Bacterial membrane protein YfhO
MPAILLYVPVAIALIALWHRYVQPISRAAAIALLLLPLCFTGRALLTGRVYGPIDLPYMSEPLLDYATEHGIERRPTGQAKIHNGTISDLYMQMIPWQAAVRSSLSKGDWPLWNPYMLCGSMLAANMQSAPYDPFQLIALVLRQPQAMTFGAAMTFFLAGLFTFGFARVLGLGEGSSLIGAAAFMFSANIAFFVGWPLGRTWTIFPFVLTGVRLVVRETTIRASVLLTTAFALLIVVGHPESVLHAVTVGAAYGLFEVLSTRRFKAIALAAISGAIALLLTAIALLPFFEAAPQTAEFMIRHEFYKKMELPFGRKEILKRAGVSVLPWYGGQPEHDNWAPDWDSTTIRTGALTMALALASLVLARRRKETWFFFGTAVICIWIGLNAWPLADWLHRVPLFDITINDRLTFPAAFALAMLAAFAADGWPGRLAVGGWRLAGAEPTAGEPSPANRQLPTANSAVAGGIVLGVAIAIGILTYAVYDSRIAIGVKPELISTLTWAALVPLAIVAFLLFRRTSARVALPIVLGLLLLQRTMEDGQIYPTLPERMFYPPTPILSHMQNDKSEPFRMGAMHFMFLPDAAALYGLEDVRGYEAMTFLRLAETYAFWSVHNVASYNNIPDKSRPMLSYLNMKYLIALPAEQPDEQWKVVLEDRNARLLENTRVLDRVFIPRRIRYEKTKENILFGMSKNEDVADITWIEAPEYAPHEIGNGRGTIDVKREGLRTWNIKAEFLEDGWIVLSEAAWKGWRAYVDGKRVETRYANHAFLGVFVPKGKHDVRVVYQPEAFTRGRNITAFTILGLIGFFGYRRAKRT